jgi:hypothetical protein
VELGKSYGLVHKLTGHRIIGGASKQTAPHIFSKKFKIVIKKWAKVYQKIMKIIELISAVQTIVKNAYLLK